MLTRVLIPCALAGAIHPGAAGADTLQERVLAGMRAARADAHAFTRTIAVERMGAEAGRKVFVERYDPSRPLPARWSLLSVDGRAPTAKEAERSRKAKRGPVPAYADLAKWFGAPATRIEAGPGRVAYRFARLPTGAVKLGSHDASANMAAEAVVNTGGPVPFVERVSFNTAKPFRMMLVASVKSMAVVARYRRLGDGTPVPADTAGDVAGSLLGKAGRIRTTTTFADFRPVG